MAERPGVTGPGGDWPNTTRVLPWLIAGFLAMLWLIPIDGTYLPIRLPFDSTIDRAALLVILLAWVVALGAREYGPRWHRSKVNAGVFVFLLVATASVLLNLTAVARAEELQLALKKLSLLLCYTGFFVVVATSVRPRELQRFLILILALASITALGTVVEYRTGIDHFYRWAAKLPIVSVAAEPGDRRFGRPSIVGPTQHGLADATILAMVVPIAIVGVMRSRRLPQKMLYAIALGLLFAGMVATLRKTALVLPLVVVVVLLIYQPRRMMRLAPLGLLMIVAMQAISPGALAGIRYQIEGGSKLSNEGRTNDYTAVQPDLVSHPLIGRGYGTYDPRINQNKHRDERHRILDNQVLMLLIEIGVLGLAAYLAIGALGIAGLHRRARARDPSRAGPALAVIGAICAFLVSNLLFDTLAFPQVPYVFFCLLALGVVTMAGDDAAQPQYAR